MSTERTSVGLDVYARSVAAAAIDGVTGELFQKKLPSGNERILEWSYTTVVAEATEFFEPVIADAESQAPSWVAVDDVAGLALQPGFAAGWPARRGYLV